MKLNLNMRIVPKSSWKQKFHGYKNKCFHFVWKNLVLRCWKKQPHPHQKTKMVCPYFFFKKKSNLESIPSYLPFVICHVQWATLVMHHFLRVHIFSQKCWNRTFSMLIYLLTLCLFDDVEKNIGITHVNHSTTPEAILTKVHDCTCNLNVYIFYLRFALGIIHGDHCDWKTPKTIILFK